ncbi:MAG: hypothetical protein E2576_12510 [Alcaligenaceae bacterium]|nr:hypothetical protein [Alcaligenaceae bacterium SAGV5]MPS52473.1 hypothetical protein [Alcaligenaceae bacterium SAGV3]MPT57537.1 hypothetical protein [Alcaligenaceae bacterium]
MKDFHRHACLPQAARKAASPDGVRASHDPLAFQYGLALFAKIQLRDSLKEAPRGLQQGATRPSEPSR